jgi:Common central domain of tyrosinase/Polyphenol oxidase middle domain
MELHSQSRRDFFRTSAGLLVAGVATARAGAAKVVVRKDLGTLDNDSPEIKGLAKAYAKMKDIEKENPNDPHAWSYQGNMHGIRPSNNMGPDGVWNVCQHGHWWFFPWHRAYIYFFERIVRKYADDLSFALPYWHWDKTDASQLVVHAAFRPGGPLFGLDPRLNDRKPAVNEGTEIVDAAVIHTGKARAMREPAFAIGPNQPGFGGPILTNPAHSNRLHGRLELAVHDEIHDDVGGMMGDVMAAANDPLFWVHHSNVDRLWVEWLKLGGGRSNPDENDPAQKGWFKPTFEFYDEDKNKVSIGVKDLLDTTKLGYEYDMFPNFRFAAAQKLTEQVRPVEVESVATEDKHKELGAEPLRVSLALPERARRSFAGLTSKKGGSFYAQLTLHGVTFSDGKDSVIRVYLGLPEDVKHPTPKDPHYAGSFSLFQHGDNEHGGITTILPIDSAVADIWKTTGFTGEALSVTLVREDPTGKAAKFKSKLTFDKLTLEVGEATKPTP